MATKQVAVKQQSSAVAVVDDDLLNLGTGLEDTSSDDFAIPFLQMLQALSPVSYTHLTLPTTPYV